MLICCLPLWFDYWQHTPCERGLEAREASTSVIASSRTSWRPAGRPAVGVSRFFLFAWTCDHAHTCCFVVIRSHCNHSSSAGGVRGGCCTDSFCFCTCTPFFAGEALFTKVSPPTYPFVTVCGWRSVLVYLCLGFSFSLRTLITLLFPLDQLLLWKIF